MKFLMTDLKRCKNCGYDLTDGMFVADGQTICPSCFAQGGGRSELSEDFGWYGCGYAVCKSGGAIPGWIPPVDDPEAWQEFIEGFGAAHADDIDHKEAEAILSGRTDEIETTSDALLRILKFPLWDQIKGLA